MQLLKQSTSATVTVGPVLDANGAAYASAVIGDFSISKNGTRAALASAATATHVHNGIYDIALTTGNTDTLGRADITCNKSGYAMSAHRYMVVTAKTYTAIITAGAGEADGLWILGNNAGASVVTMPDCNWGDVTVGLLGINDGPYVNGIAIFNSLIIRSGMAQAGSSTTITFDASASSVANLYVGAIVSAGLQTRVITAYDGTTKVATVDRAWASNPTNGSDFVIFANLGLSIASSGGTKTVEFKGGGVQLG